MTTERPSDGDRDAATGEATGGESPEGSEPSGPADRATRVYRSVSTRYGPHGDAEMNAVGWALFLGVVFLLVPLLPIIVVVWVVSKAVGAVAKRQA
ncbi:MAG: hypothetical protein ABEH78_07830 [Haloferacaceae archaeon]